ncbi:MAG: UvrB/UvrC motif-containing protein [Firmicutes bacterium]|nr:UvrB/UvrC motif-containing protein [Bacillota bacterium]
MSPGNPVPLSCQRCQRRPASVHFTRVVNGEKSERYLCEECAREEGAYHFMLDPQLTVHNVLGGLIGQVPESSHQGTSSQVVCPHCGYTYQRFAETGRLGCDRCYETFRPQLDPLVRRIQGAVTHHGKIPGRAGARLKVRQQVEHLRDQLHQAVDAEAFEEAAKLRDEIRRLEVSSTEE